MIHFRTVIDFAMPDLPEDVVTERRSEWESDLRHDVEMVFGDDVLLGLGHVESLTLEVREQ